MQSAAVVPWIVLLATIASSVPSHSLRTTPRPNPCSDQEIQEARAVLREAVQRVSSTLSESVSVPGVSSNGYVLYNGTLSPLRLTDVNVTAQLAVCQENVRHFPFVIAVGTNNQMKGIYEYHYAGNNVTTPEESGRVAVTFTGVSFNGKLTQHLGETQGEGPASRPEVTRVDVTLREYPSFSGIATGPQNPQRSGVPYFDMMQAADRSFVPVFAKLPETHVLPALKAALGIE
uniref:Putative secreted protein n=1 Tax=Amblyomma triste TaxID=251400 RepID=A0A023G5M6_AMBTT